MLNSFTQKLFLQMSHEKDEIELTTEYCYISAKIMKMILEEIGTYFESIGCNNLNTNTLEMLTKYCPNVTLLKINKTSQDLKLDSIKRNIKFFANIEILEIHDAPIVDKTIKTLMMSSNLVSLHLENCNKIRGKCFSKDITIDLKFLKVIKCSMVDCDQILKFLKNRRHIKFSADRFSHKNHHMTDPFTKSYDYHNNLIELELVLDSCCTAEYSECIILEDFQQLVELTITPKNDRPDYNFDIFVAALFKIKTLTSLIIKGVEVTDVTMKSLGSIKNLKKLQLIDITSADRKTMYSSLAENLPKLTELSINIQIALSRRLQLPEKIVSNCICEMIGVLSNLSYFTHSQMTLPIMEDILLSQIRRKQSPLKIGIYKFLFSERMKVTYLI